MIVLDADILSVLDAGRGEEFEILVLRLGQPDNDSVCATVISLEEQMRGWLSYIAASRRTSRQIEGYARLHALLRAYRDRALLDFDDDAAKKFEKIKPAVRIGSMDLKIASICLVHDALLISRNLRDFRRVKGLRVEDWTIPG